VFFVFLRFPPGRLLAVGNDLNKKGPRTYSEGKVVASSQSGMDILGKRVDKIYREPNDCNPSSYDEEVSA